MTDDKKDVTEKIVDSFKEFEDLKEYSNSQYKVIITQSKKISELEKKLEQMEERALSAEKTNTISGALSSDQSGGNNDDGTTICLVQLALLRNSAMMGELTLEECKKVEIYVKTLQAIKGKDDGKKKSDGGKVLSNEDLIKLMDNVLVL